MIIGDLNAKIGRCDTGEEDTVGPFGIGVRNERGARLVNFATSHGLKILNSFFKKRPNRKWTWESPNGDTKNEIDFIMFHGREYFTDVEVLNNFEFDSDHRIVRGSMRFNEKMERSRKMMKYHLPGAKILKAKNEFRLCLQNRFSQLQEIDENWTVNEGFEKFNEIVRESTKELQKKIPKTQKKSKISEATMKLIAKREVLRRERKESVAKEIDFIETRKLTRQKIREDVAKFNEKLIEEVIERNKSLKKAHSTVTNKKKWIQSVNDNGIEITNRDDILRLVTQFYKELYSGDATQIQENEVTDNDDFLPILKEETDYAVKTMKNNRAPGEDGIVTEALKAGGDLLTGLLTNLFNKVLEREEIPEAWASADIVLLHKKGSKSEVKNYRPISLLSHTYKIFMKILQKRLERQLDDNQTREQAGFRKGYSTMDHIHVMNQMIEKSQEYNLPLYIAWVDYEKAFDSVQHEDLFQALWNQGIRGKPFRTLRLIYQEATARVKLENTGEKFNIMKGVRQGDPLSPKLFSAILEDVCRRCDWPETAGINVDGERLSVLRFADDLVLICSTPDDLQEMLEKLRSQSERVGLKINTEKTKLMTNRTHVHVTINGETVHYVSEFLYLGQIMAIHNRQTREVDRRIQNSWKAFWKLKNYLLSRNIQLNLRRRLFDMCILPVMTYGAQTWSLTARQEEKLRVAQRAMERRMLGITRRDRIRNEEIRRRTGVKDVILEANNLKWSWAGHIARRQDNRWTRRVTEWRPRGEEARRSRGRQRRRWRDVFPRDWQNKAQDRRLWSEIRREAVVQVGRIRLQ